MTEAFTFADDVRVTPWWALATDQPDLDAFIRQGRAHPNAIKLREAIDRVTRGSLDVSDAFAPDLVWRIVGNHALAGDYHASRIGAV
jgi:hypothetical protein